MKKLVLSTNNKGKIEELKNILQSLEVRVLSKSDIGLGELEVIEDGETLEANALKKAREIYINLEEKDNTIVLADDTGLFVEALKGKPGVYSARYAGEDADPKKNNIKLLENLKGIDKRQAYFETIIALILPGGKELTVSGRCYGKIGYEKKGENGFGYDPLFIVDGYNKTFAELDSSVKNKISHRALALNKVREKLQELVRD